MRNWWDQLAQLGPTCPSPTTTPPGVWSQSKLWPATLDLFARFSAWSTFASSTAFEVAILKPRAAFISFLDVHFNLTSHDPQKPFWSSRKHKIQLSFFHPPSWNWDFLFEHFPVLRAHVEIVNQCIQFISILFYSFRSWHRDYRTPN